MRRRESRIRYGLIAVVALALAWSAVALISSPPASAEVPGPLLLAGSDCDENGPFIQYRVTNETDRAETLAISIDGSAVIGSARIGSEETKRGRIEWRGNVATSVALEAKWATNEQAPVSSITVAPNPCATVTGTDFTGPAFMAGTDCRDDVAIVRWWMSNSSDEDRMTYVSISDEEGSVGETIWPGDGSSELMFAGAQTSGVTEIPEDFIPGSILRVSGWAEGSGGIAETWTQMLIPMCVPGGQILAGGSSTTSVDSTNPNQPATTADPLDGILATPPPVATTAGAVDGSSTTSTTQPGETTTTQPGQTTTTAPPGSTTTSPPGSTTTRPPGSSTTTSPPTTTTTTTGPTTTTTTTTAPPTDLEAPVFLAGADCNANGAFIRYRVTNNNDTALDLKVTFNGSTRVDSVSVAAGQSKWGTFTGTGGSNDPKPVVASWSGHSGTAAPTLLFRASLCAAGLPQPARGPAFVAGQDCSGSSPVVRWWMKNTAATTQPMNVTITKSNNGGELIMWPSGGGTVDVDPDVQTAGVYTLPSGYNSVGQEVRIRGWWREIDASAHNRVGIVIGSCS